MRSIGLPVTTTACRAKGVTFTRHRHGAKPLAPGLIPEPCLDAMDRASCHDRREAIEKHSFRLLPPIAQSRNRRIHPAVLFMGCISAGDAALRS